MRRWFIGVMVAVSLLFGGSHKAQAQLATFDFGNLTQAILSFLQDGDNIALNTSQFLQNLGVMEEQLEFLREINERYREVRSDLYRVQEVIRIAQTYEMTLRMFSHYVERINNLERDDLNYYQVRNLVNQGFQFLLIASREVKRAREYLDSRNEMSEDQRRKGLQECDKQMCRTNVAMYNHIMDSYGAIDRGRMFADTVESIDEAFAIKW